MIDLSNGEKWVQYADVWLSQAQDTHFWNLFDSGAELGEIAAEFGLTVSKIRDMLHLPDPEEPLSESNPVD